MQWKHLCSLPAKEIQGSTIGGNTNSFLELSRNITAEKSWDVSMCCATRWSWQCGLNVADYRHIVLFFFVITPVCSPQTWHVYDFGWGPSPVQPTARTLPRLTLAYICGPSRPHWQGTVEHFLSYGMHNRMPRKRRRWVEIWVCVSIWQPFPETVFVLYARITCNRKLFLKYQPDHMVANLTKPTWMCSLSLD
jgi:hypothetical protein